MSLDRRLDFVIGEEKSLSQLLDSSETLLLLNGAIRAGASGVSVQDSEGRLVAACGTEEGQLFSRRILVEGEPVGRLDLWGDKPESHMNGVVDMLHCAVQLVIRSSMKRLLTSEAHTTVVNLTYDELLETNRQLAVSEQRYRELAESLEVKVQERTRELQDAQAAMLQQAKMASIGQLAAGMAHEINNPIGFILSNLSSLERYNQRMLEMLDTYRTALDVVSVAVEIKQQIEDRRKQLKLEFIVKDSPELLAQSIAGAERISRIVTDLKGFSHVDEVPADGVEINRELLLTLAVLKPQLAADAELVTDLAPQLPAAAGNPLQLNQAFWAILQNSLDFSENKLRITVATRLEHGMLVVDFSDNGPGIPHEMQQRIFEPFFTTKEVGAGMGMGLTVAHQAVTACGGSMALSSTPGAGTQVIIRLPLKKENQ